MPTLDRRQFLQLATALGATLAWGCAHVRPSSSGWREHRDLYPQGVASGDPDDNSVLLWTRRPYADGRKDALLLVEVADDPAFTRVVATTSARVLAQSDWTCRVLVGHLPPGREYWYRFVDEEGNGSRIGRTLTAPGPDDNRQAKFAFVSCQSLPEGYGNGYRKMIFEDERAAPEEKLGFVLHLGDFVYEVVQYPDQVKDGHRYDRLITFPVKFPKGKVVARNRFWVPDSLDDYRVLYHAYLQDPDLQDARALALRVHLGQPRILLERLAVDPGVPWHRRLGARADAQGRGQPSLVRIPAGAGVAAGLEAGHLQRAARCRRAGQGIRRHRLGTEPNNLAAIESLIIYRALRWGRHIDLLLTDNRSFRSRDPGNHDEINPLFADDTLGFVPEELWAQLDAGRDYAGGHPPAQLTMGDKRVANYVANAAPQTMLGTKQKAWFLDKLRGAKATWKIWGNSQGTLDWRVDPQNLPPELGKWKGAGYGLMATSDWGGMYTERAEIFDAVRDAGITGLAIVTGDRHAFWAGYAAKALPPAAFEPVGVSFVGGSLISPGMAEANEHTQKKENNPTRPLYIAEDASGKPQPTANLTLHHGVRSALEYASSGDLQKALAVRNPELAPHLTFVDVGGHGYATVRVDANAMTTEFVCIPRPIERSAGEDGGPLRYRVRHEVPLWRAGERPQMRQTVVEGDAGLAV